MWKQGDRQSPQKEEPCARRNGEVVAIQVFFLKSRIVGSDARSVRHAGLRVGTGVRDEDVDDFSHSAGIEEDVPRIGSFPPSLPLGGNRSSQTGSLSLPLQSVAMLVFVPYFLMISNTLNLTC